MQNKPHPIGYVEYQHSWVGDASIGYRDAVVECIKDKAGRESPGLAYYSYRYEHTKDGAGVEHYAVYVGFAPPVPSSDPLDPRNLNDAPLHDQIGDAVRDFSVGMKEQKF